MNDSNPVLGLGVILNFANLLLKHLGVYDKLKVPDGVRDFITVAVCIVLLIGFIILALGPEKMAALREWKSHLFGG